MQRNATVRIASVLSLAIGITLVGLSGRILAADGDTKPASARGGADMAAIWEPQLLVQLRVSDLDRAISFYRDTLGFELFHRNDELHWAKLHAPVQNVNIGLGVATDATGSGGLSLNFSVKDIDEARRVLEAKGVKFDGPTITIPNVVRLADFRDPDGNRIRLAGDAG